MKNREVGTVFVTKLMKLQGTKRAQYINSAFESLTIAKSNEVLREHDHTGKYALVRVTEFSVPQVDEHGDPVMDDQNQIVYSDQKIVRNQIEAVGSYDDIAKMAYADDLLEAQREDFVQDQLEQMRLERKARRVAPAAGGVVIKDNQETANVEPSVGA